MGIAIGIVLLPDLSRRLQADDTDGGQNALSRAAEMSLALAVPAAVALVVIPTSLIGVLFERGAFDAVDTQATALACAIYGLGLPAFVLQKVLQPLYFAREDTRRPFKFALVAMLVNAGLAIGLAPLVGYIAAAIGTTLAGWAMLWLLWHGTRDMGPAARFDDRSKTRCGRITIAAAIMGAGLLVADRVLAGLIDGAGLTQVLGLALLCLFGALVYGVAGIALKAFTVADLKSAFRRQR